MGIYRIPSVSREAVHYWPLAGQTLHQLIRTDADSADLRDELDRAWLHPAGDENFDAAYRQQALGFTQR